MSITPFQLLLSNSKENYIKCGSCNKNITNAHLICFRFYITKHDNRVYWESTYTVGCTLEDLESETWYDRGVTIANNKIMCQVCGKHDFGKPNIKNNKLRYIWVDGSESSYVGKKNEIWYHH